MYLAVVGPHYALFRYFGAAKRRGLKTLALTHDADNCRAQESEYHAWTHTPDVTEIDTLLVGSVLSPDAIIEALTPYRAEIAGILPGDEEVVPQVLQAATALGFDGPDPEDARCQHIKSAMKLRLAERGVRTAPFRIVHTIEEAEAAWEWLNRDCMMKVVNEASGMHVYRVHSKEELHAAWAGMTADHHTEMLLEEFIGGRQVSAEGFVKDGEITIINSCEKTTSDRFVVIGHYVPSHLTPAERATVEEAAADCVRALGIHNSVFHAEIHLLDGVPYVIECAARPPGQFMTDVIDAAYDVDLAGINIDLAVGNPVDVTPHPPRQYFSQISFWTPRSGTFTGVAGLDELRAGGHLHSCYIQPQPGDHIEALKLYTNRYGAMVLADDTPEGIAEKSAWAADHVWLEVTPDPGTDHGAGPVEGAHGEYHHADRVG